LSSKLDASSTDEQDCDTAGQGAPSKADAFGTRNYLINVASAKNGIGYRKWTHIDGFSEAVLKWVPAFEAAEVKAVWPLLPPTTAAGPPYTPSGSRLGS
jgi:hypothetical protein